MSCSLAIKEAVLRIRCLPESGTADAQTQNTDAGGPEKLIFLPGLIYRLRTDKWKRKCSRSRETSIHPESFSWLIIQGYNAGSVFMYACRSKDTDNGNQRTSVVELPKAKCG